MKLTSEASESRYTIEALARGLEVLSLFSARTPTLTLTEIVAAVGHNKSRVFRIVTTLETLGYLERDAASKRYRPSLKVLQLGFTALNTLDVRQVARPYLEQLALRFDETTSLVVLDGKDIVYVDRVRNRSIVGVVLGVGSRVPAHSTSLGKVLLADFSPAALSEWLSRNQLEPFTQHTITDSARLARELDVIRARGYALSEQELAIGLCGVAAPIRDGSRKAIAAINISGPITTISSERLLNELMPAVVDAAAHISLALGYSPSP